MPKGRVITRSVTTSRPLNMTLNLECSEEPLSETQLLMRIKLKENYDRVAATLEELSKDHSGTMVCQAGPVNGYQYTIPPNSGQGMVKGPSQTVLNVNQNKAQAIKLNVLNNTGASSGNIQLVVDPRMGVILGQVSQPQGATTTTAPTISASSPTAHTQPENPAPTPVRGRQKLGGSTHVVAATTTSPQGVTNLRIKSVNKQQQQQPPSQAQVPTRPTEHTSIGGIAVGSKYPGEQQDESRKNLPDGREISFNKMNGGRTFPSLVVVARPNLRTKDTPLQVAQKERSELDMKVKSVLMFSATKFAEWLIQQGLVRSEQHCVQHSNNYHKAKLKLGMYSDQGTFPYSGGYVWISNCCPERFVSVFSGSIFQGAPYTPTVLLKLIYHWACQTNVQNVISWVKVSNVYVKNFYTHLRSVCTAALWEKCRKMGGENSTIQVGVISLGTTSQDGNLRQVKVEVLGVLDLGTLELRLRACDPVQDVERSYKRRFNNILYPLKDWVHTDSKIVTDFTVDKSTLQEMGFNYVTQSAFSEQTSRNAMSNYHIMEYLRKIVPRMFQNTLSLLSRQMIQQFLDELVWREMYGSTTARAFDNIILHIAEQTMLDVDDSLLDRLAKIAANPFQDWSYVKFNTNQSLTASIASTVHQEPTTTCSEASTIAPIIVTTPAPTSASTSLPSSSPLTTSSATVSSAQNIRSQQDMPTVKVGAKRGRKRILPPTSNVESPEPSKSAADAARSTLREKEREQDSKSFEQIQLQEFYYATMEGDKTVLLKEHKSSVCLKCFLCPVVMRSNTQVMEHTIGHVPPQMPDQSDSPVCRYCCTIFSSEHQMLTHVSETHSNFGQSESHMVVCAICEQKFANSSLLVDHLSSTHYPSEMPYRCDACGYRTSSHKDAVDHFYKVHEMGDSLQCPYCLKVMQFVTDGKANATGVHAYLLHMQRHVIRREQGRGNKCSRCCLWFNQKSSLKSHQRELHDGVTSSKVVPYSGGENTIMIPRQRMQYRRFDVDSPTLEVLNDERIRRWSNGPITIKGTYDNLACQECEEDIDEQDHYPAEQRCRQCRYITCCWRAFREHQQQIHNERPMTSLTVPSPLINIPLEKKMQCPCGYGTTDGNRLASHLVKCKKVSAYPVEDAAPTGMLNSLGLVPKSTAEEVSLDGKRAGPR